MQMSSKRLELYQMAHITKKLKDSYKPVQHPTRSVPLGMQSAYKAELDRLVKEGIITEVWEHTDWIKSVMPVMKEDSSLSLCLTKKT